MVTGRAPTQGLLRSSQRTPVRRSRTESTIASALVVSTGRSAARNSIVPATRSRSRYGVHATRAPGQIDRPGYRCVGRHGEGVAASGAHREAHTAIAGEIPEVGAGREHRDVRADGRALVRGHEDATPVDPEPETVIRDRMLPPRRTTAWASWSTNRAGSRNRCPSTRTPATMRSESWGRAACSSARSRSWTDTGTPTASTRASSRRNPAAARASENPATIGDSTSPTSTPSLDSVS